MIISKESRYLYPPVFHPNNTSTDRLQSQENVFTYVLTSASISCQPVCKTTHVVLNEGFFPAFTAPVPSLQHARNVPIVYLRTDHIVPSCFFFLCLGFTERKRSVPLQVFIVTDKRCSLLLYSRWLLLDKTRTGLERRECKHSTTSGLSSGDHGR